MDDNQKSSGGNISDTDKVSGDIQKNSPNVGESSGWVDNENIKTNNLPEKEIENSGNAGVQAPVPNPESQKTSGEAMNVNQNQNPHDVPPADATLPSQAVIASQSSSKGGGFKIFVIIGLLIVVAVWGGVGYLYIQNQNTKKDKDQDTASEVTPIATPTPEFSPEQIMIENGSIVLENHDGEEIMLVDKENYESTGITGFLKVAVSPSLKKMCFESWPPATKPAVYVSDIDGQNVVEVSLNKKNCVWSDDSTRIFYVNTAPDNSPVNIYEYDLIESLEKDVTSGIAAAGKTRRYEIVGLSADGTKIICSYEELGTASGDVSQCEIDLQTGAVNDL